MYWRLRDDAVWQGGRSGEGAECRVPPHSAQLSQAWRAVHIPSEVIFAFLPISAQHRGKFVTSAVLGCVARSHLLDPTCSSHHYKRQVTILCLSLKPSKVTPAHQEMPKWEQQSPKHALCCCRLGVVANIGQVSCLTRCHYHLSSLQPACIAAKI